jgi:hypothetical protein
VGPAPPTIRVPSPKWGMLLEAFYGVLAEWQGDLRDSATQAWVRSHASR